jgi:CBS domain-containing protein
MTADVVSVSPNQSVRHAARLMLEHRISGRPVLDDDGRVVGIVTEGDLMRRSELGGQALARPFVGNSPRARSTRALT